MFKNMVEDKSSYTKGKEIIPRGQLENIAVKLYGNQYESAHPTSSTADNDGIFTPWFQTRGKAFKVKRYHYIDGGANAANTGSFSDKTVDVAVLTLYERLVTTYFNQLPLSLPDVFDRLKWVKHKRDKLTSKYLSSDLYLSDSAWLNTQDSSFLSLFVLVILLVLLFCGLKDDQ